MYEFLVEPWVYGTWMWRAALTGLLVAVPSAVLGVFLYLRRLSLVADALSHVALPGIVAAFLLSGSLESGYLLVGAIVTGILTTFLIEKLMQVSNTRSDASIGIVFTIMFSIGVIAISTLVHSVDLDVSCVLYGNLLGITDQSIWTLAISSPLILLFVGIFWRWLAVLSFDKTYAMTLGIPIALMHYTLTTLVATTAVISFEAVGTILVMGLIIIPAAAAHRIANHLRDMVLYAVGFAIISTFVGLYISIWINSSPTGSIVTFMGIAYGFVFVFTSSNGIIQRMKMVKSKSKVRI